MTYRICLDIFICFEALRGAHDRRPTRRVGRPGLILTYKRSASTYTPTYAPGYIHVTMAHGKAHTAKGIGRFRIARAERRLVL